MSTGKTYAATVVGTDAKDDVAVLQLSGASGLDTVTADTDGVVGRRRGHRGRRRERHRRLPQRGQRQGHGARTTPSPPRARRTAEGERLTGLHEDQLRRHLRRLRRRDVRRGRRGRRHDDGGVRAAAPSRRVRRAHRQGALASSTTWRAGSTSSRYDYDRPAFLGSRARPRPAPRSQGVYEARRPPRPGIAAGDRITAIGVDEGQHVGAAAGGGRAGSPRRPGERHLDRRDGASRDEDGDAGHRRRE